MSGTQRRAALQALPITPSIAEKLQAAGFYTVGEVLAHSVTELAKELGVAAWEAQSMKKEVETAIDFKPEVVGKSADSWRADSTLRPIVTFCHDVDQLLGGGIPLGEVTELCGIPGVGKTQFGMQLALDVQIPESLGGVMGKAVYIDSEGSFSVERLLQMASALSEHLLALLKKGAEKKLPDSLLDAVSTSSLLANIHVLRVHDHAEQMAAVRMLPSFCASHPGVRLIVLDSIAFHFRHAFHDMAHRTRVLSDMLQQLNKVARSHQLAVLLVNQMTTQVLHDSSRVVPALGDTLAHAVTNRVVLYWKEERRIAHLNKSSRLPEGEAEFAVLQSGIRKPPPKCRSAKRYKSDDVHL